MTTPADASEASVGLCCRFGYVCHIDVFVGMFSR